MNAQQELTRLAKDYLGVNTLETRNSDALDFHNVAVWNIAAILEHAYNAGRESCRPALDACESCLDKYHGLVFMLTEALEGCGWNKPQPIPTTAVPGPCDCWAEAGESHRPGCAKTQAPAPDAIEVAAQAAEQIDADELEAHALDLAADRYAGEHLKALRLVGEIREHLDGLEPPAADRVHCRADEMAKTRADLLDLATWLKVPAVVPEPRMTDSQRKALASELFDILANQAAVADDGLAVLSEVCDSLSSYWGDMHTEALAGEFNRTTGDCKALAHRWNDGAFALAGDPTADAVDADRRGSGIS